MSNNYVLLGGNALHPTSVEAIEEKIEDVTRMANGKRRVYHRAIKNSWTLSWTNLPETSLPVIRTLYRYTGTMPFVDVDGVSFTVQTTGFTHNLSAERTSMAGVYHYDVTLEITEV